MKTNTVKKSVSSVVTTPEVNTAATDVMSKLAASTARIAELRAKAAEAKEAARLADEETAKELAATHAERLAVLSPLRATIEESFRNFKLLASPEEVKSLKDTMFPRKPRSKNSSATEEEESD